MSEIATVGTDVAKLSSSVDITSLDTAARLGMWLAAAESGSKDPKALGMSAALRIAYAGSLGLPAHAASEVFIIKGNLTISAKMKRALAHQHGLRVTKVEETPTSCTAAVIQVASGKELGRYTFTLEMAKKAGLAGTNWTNHPDRMLFARASSRVLDDFAPWVTVGVMSYEDARDLEPEAPLPFDSDEVLVGEVVDHEGSAEEPSDATVDPGAHVGVADSVQAHAPESSSADTFTEKAKKAGLVQGELA